MARESRKAKAEGGGVEGVTGMATDTKCCHSSTRLSFLLQCIVFRTFR